MDRVRLRKVFGRFRKDELPEVMGLLGLEEGGKAASKRELVTSLVDKCMVSMLLTSRDTRGPVPSRHGLLNFPQTAKVALRDVLQVELQCEWIPFL